MGCCLGPARGARIPWICQPGALDPLWGAVAGSRMTRFRGKEVALQTGPGAPLRPAREPPRGGGGGWGAPPSMCLLARRGQEEARKAWKRPEEARKRPAPQKPPGLGFIFYTTPWEVPEGPACMVPVA